MSNATAATGSLLKRGNGATPTETFTTISEITDLNLSLNGEIIDVTSHDSSGAFREKLSALLELGVTFEMNYLPNDATQDESAGLMADFLNRAKRNFQIQIASDPTITVQFSAYVTQFDIKMPVGDKLSASGTLSGASGITFP